MRNPDFMTERVVVNVGGTLCVVDADGVRTEKAEPTDKRNIKKKNNGGFTMLAKELDYVRTKDDRKGTIVMEFSKPNVAYEIEYDGSDGDTDTILPDDIVEVIARYGK